MTFIAEVLLAGVVGVVYSVGELSCRALILFFQLAFSSIVAAVPVLGKVLEGLFHVAVEVTVVLYNVSNVI